MDPRPLHDSPHHELPQSISELGLQSIYAASVADERLHDDPAGDSSALTDFFFCSSELTASEWPQWTFEAQDPPIPNEFHHSMLELADVNQPQLSEDTGSPADIAPLSNVSQWLDGAYRPPVPCTHCRRRRLQCLIIRTAPANPNPVTSCSSCVALFRECSLSRGEKRLPSRFETFTPVLGHLHGLPEQTEDGVRIILMCDRT